MSMPEFSNIFQAFCNGPSTMTFEAFEINDSHLVQLTGLPPYNLEIINHPDFPEKWDCIGAALYGFFIREYLKGNQGRLTKFRQIHATSLAPKYHDTFNQLTEQWKLHQKTSLSLLEDDGPTWSINHQNLLWTARQIVFLQEDLEGLSQGGHIFQKRLCQRARSLQQTGTK
jgi:hypothetical protein